VKLKEEGSSEIEGCVSFILYVNKFFLPGILRRIQIEMTDR
jgi:hypothetical protein